jgi:hypothetical protein
MLCTVQIAQGSGLSFTAQQSSSAAKVHSIAESPLEAAVHHTLKVAALSSRAKFD